MKQLLGIAVILSMVAAACQNGGVSSVKLTNEKDSASYYMGFVTANQRFTQNGMDTLINAKAVMYGIDQAMGKKVKIDDNTAYQYINKYLNAKYMAMMEKMKVDAEKFMEDNKTKPGVVVDSSGIQYQVLVQGTGPHPSLTDKVMVKYEGKFTNDSVFDSNLKSPEPAIFGLNQVIRGWGIGLQLMTVGSKYKLFIPPTLGYGEQGNKSIPPQSVLIFEVELVGIAPADAPKKNAKK
jgi:FKBP-type peptidyl-prolyl cis-trans isomerase